MNLLRHLRFYQSSKWNAGPNQKNFVWKMDWTHAQGGIKHSKYFRPLFTVVIPLGVYISWFSGTWIINAYEKSYQKLAFVFAHVIKTFDPRVSYAFSCFDIMVNHSRAFLIYNLHYCNFDRENKWKIEIENWKLLLLWKWKQDILLNCQMVRLISQWWETGTPAITSSGYE